MRWAALMCAGTLVLVPPSASVQEHPELARLTEELTARSGPGFCGETDGPLVRDHGVCRGLGRVRLGPGG